MKPLIDLLFPSFCPHCEGPKQRGFLCPLCSEDVDFLDEEPSLSPSLLNGASYALDLEGANLTLYRLFTKEHTSLTDPLSRLLYMKYLKMRWKRIDKIVPLHKTPFYKQHPDFLLMKGMERLMKPSGNQEGNLLIVSTLFEIEKLEQRAIELSRALPASIYALSLWLP